MAGLLALVALGLVPGLTTPAGLVAIASLTALSAIAFRMSLRMEDPVDQALRRAQRAIWLDEDPRVVIMRLRGVGLRGRPRLRRDIALRNLDGARRHCLLEGRVVEDDDLSGRWTHARRIFIVDMFMDGRGDQMFVVRDVEAKLGEMVRRIVEGFHPEKIILFGSRARGDAKPDSDADLLVVMRVRGSRRRQAARIDAALAGVGLPKDIIIVTPDEFERLRQVVGGIVYPAAREGRVLYDRAG